MNTSNHKPIVVLGDIHGLSLWQDVVQQHPGCRYVFLGDYVDPYYPIAPEKVLDNFLRIVEFKRRYPSEVVLILGNHDLHYRYNSVTKASRYSVELVYDYRTILLENEALFQYAWQQGHCLFTHAGVSEAWFAEDFHGDRHRSLADQLNHPTRDQFRAMCQVGLRRGGTAEHGGIFWADLQETCGAPLKGFHQYVGHSKVREVHTVRLSEDTSITYCDALRHHDFAFIPAV